MHAAASGESSTIGYYVVFSLIENREGRFMFVKRKELVASVKRKELVASSLW